VYKLEITDSAIKDLEEITAYISITLANTKATADFLEEVELCYHQLKRNPFVFEKCRDSRLARKGLYRAIIK
jgi:plasmid stabilization system protein ParE